MPHSKTIRYAKTALFTTLLALLAVLASAQQMTFAPSALVDQSHDFKFVVSHFAGALNQTGFRVVDSYADFPPQNLNSFNLLVLHQDNTSIPWDAASTQAVDAFLRQGGGVLVFDDNGYRNPASPPNPINQILEKYGLHVTRRWEKVPLYVHSASSWGQGFYITQFIRRSSVIISTDPQHYKLHPVITDPAGRCVMGWVNVGNGRLLVTGEMMMMDRTPTAVHDMFAVKLLNDTVTNSKVNAVWTNITSWLATGSTTPIYKPKVLPAHTSAYPVNFAANGKLRVYYTLPLRTRALFILAKFSKIYKLLQNMYHCHPVQLTLMTLATDGGAWTSTPRIALGALADNTTLQGFMLWEMTNAWPLPQPPSWVEGWTSFTHTLLSSTLRLQGQRVKSMPFTEQELTIHADDPTNLKINIAKRDLEGKLGRSVTGHRWNYLKTIKIGLLLDHLYRRYGVQLFRRLIHIHHAIYSAETTTDNNIPISLRSYTIPSFSEYVREWSLAAGRNMSHYFHRWGATFSPPNLPAANAQIKALGDSLVLKDKQMIREDKNAKQVYEANRQQLSNSSWINSISLKHNFLGDVPASDWIENLQNPPARLAYLAVHSGVDEHGFLVIHPKTPDTPCVMAVTEKVPAAGKPLLVVEGMLRKNGSPVTMRIYIDSQEVWHRNLHTPLTPFYATINLDSWLGKSIRVRVENDSNGNWGFREVLIHCIGVINNNHKKQTAPVHH